jgi:hypothetical protein
LNALIAGLNIREMDNHIKQPQELIIATEVEITWKIGQKEEVHTVEMVFTKVIF